VLPKSTDHGSSHSTGCLLIGLEGKKGRYATPVFGVGRRQQKSGSIEVNHPGSIFKNVNGEIRGEKRGFNENKKLGESLDKKQEGRKRKPDAWKRSRSQLSSRAGNCTLGEGLQGSQARSGGKGPNETLALKKKGRLPRGRRENRKGN